MATDLKTLQEAILYFSDEMNCINAVASLHWPDGKAVCPACGNREHYWLDTQKRWKCKNGKCKKQFSVKVGTIFEDSPIPLSSGYLQCGCSLTAAMESLAMRLQGP